MSQQPPNYRPASRVPAALSTTAAITALSAATAAETASLGLRLAYPCGVNSTMFGVTGGLPMGPGRYGSGWGFV
jgi:hypothetical protein